MRIFSPLASASKVSAVGDTAPLAILLIVDFEIPVTADNLREEISFSYIILSSNIFIYLVFATNYMDISGKYWK